MESLALLALLIATRAHAGTSDPGGVAGAILIVLAVAFGLWIVLVMFIGRALGRSTLVSGITAVVLPASLLAYCGFSANQRDKERDHLRQQSEQLNDQLTAVANNYLLQACARDRRQWAKPIAPADGILIEVNPNQRLKLAGVPTPAPQTAKMKKDMEQHQSAISSPAGSSTHQYELPIEWVKAFLDPGAVLRHSQFEFVEGRLSAGSERPEIVARKRWWEGPGRTQVIEEQRQHLERRLVDMRPNESLSLQAVQSRARYAVSVEDISTLEDRTHWVARARVAVRDRRSNEVVAEYVGFAANQIPAYLYAGWEKSNVCPGKEQTYVRERGPWDVVGFFFKEVVAFQDQ